MLRLLIKMLLNILLPLTNPFKVVYTNLVLYFFEGVINLAKSNARKLREKLVREGRRNPEANRSPYAFTDMKTRRTKTKKDYMFRNKYKNHSSQQGNDGSFYFGKFLDQIIM